MKNIIELSAKNRPLCENYKKELQKLFKDVDITTVPLNIYALEPKIVNRCLYKFEIEVEYGGKRMTFWHIAADKELYERLMTKDPLKEDDCIEAWQQYSLWLTRECAAEIIDWIQTLSCKI